MRLSHQCFGDASHFSTRVILSNARSASLNGPAFYRLPVNQARVTLRRETWTVPERIGDGGQVRLAERVEVEWIVVGDHRLDLDPALEQEAGVR